MHEQPAPAAAPNGARATRHCAGLGAVVATLIGAPGAVSLRLLRQVLARRAIDRALIEALRQARQPGLSHSVLRRVK